MTTTPLFRQEALDAQQAQYLRSVRIGRNPGFAVAERRIGEGDAVQADQVLFVIATDRNGIEGPTAALVAASLARRCGTIKAERALRETKSRRASVRRRQSRA